MLNLDSFSTTATNLHISADDLLRLTSSIKQLDKDALCLEEVAARIVDYLYNNVRSGSSERACVLVRFYKTHLYSQLSYPLSKQYLAKTAPAKLPGQMHRLTLLVSRGIMPEWNWQRQTPGPQVIPLHAEDMVACAPMIDQLFNQMGIDLRAALEQGSTIARSGAIKSYSVLHIGDAASSPLLAPQGDLVRTHSIKSVVGFGDLLPLGNAFAILLFFRATVSRQVAQLFAPLALSAKIPLLPFAGQQPYGR